MRCYCWQWKWKAGFSTQEGHNLLSKALVQVSNYDKMCVKKFCGKYTGILEEEISNIVSIVHKKKENKLEFHEASFLLCIIGNISQSCGSRWGRKRLEGDGKRKSVCFCLSWVKVNFQWEIGGQKEPQEPSYLCPSLTALGSVLKSSYVLCTAPHRPVSPATFREFQSPLSSISGRAVALCVIWSLCYLPSCLAS